MPEMACADPRIYRGMLESRPLELAGTIGRRAQPFDSVAGGWQVRSFIFQELCNHITTPAPSNFLKPHNVLSEFMILYCTMFLLVVRCVQPWLWLGHT